MPRPDLEDARRASLISAESHLQRLSNHVAVAEPEAQPQEQYTPKAAAATMHTASAAVQPKAEPVAGSVLHAGITLASTAPILKQAAAQPVTSSSMPVPQPEPDSGKDGSVPKAASAQPPSYSFQDIMQRRPASARQLSVLGRPPLPRLPGKPAAAAAILPQQCGKCDALEARAQELTVQLQAKSEEFDFMEKEAVELDAKCEALEQVSITGC
jgi:hypothetical protein